MKPIACDSRNRSPREPRRGAIRDAWCRVWALPALVGACLASSPVLAGGPRNNAETPGLSRWHLHPERLGAQARPMDPRLRDLVEAFGAGDYRRTRELAQAILADSSAGGLRAEAFSFLVECSLAENDTEGALACAKRLGDAAALTRAQEAKNSLACEVARLERVRDTCLQHGAAARARQELARLALRAGQGQTAVADYYRLFAADSESAEAERAVADLAAVIDQCLGPQTATAVLRGLIEQYPSKPVAATAQYQVIVINVPPTLDLRNAEELLAIVAGSPNTRAAALADSYLRLHAPDLVAALKDLAGWGKHAEVVSGFGTYAPWLASLAPDAFSDALNTLVSSARHGALALPARQTVALLLSLAECREDEGRLAALYETEGQLAAGMGDTAGAVSAWQTLLDRYPGSASAARASLLLGDYCLGVRDYGKALQAYRTARNAVGGLPVPERARAMVSTGLVLVELGREEEAAYEFRVAMALAPGSEAARTAEAALENLGR